VRPLSRLTTKMQTLEQGIHDARAAVELARLGLPYLPWPGSAIAPSALTTILNDLQINQRKTVVEFGSGLSTVYIAKVLEAVGGTITSIENDADWAALVNQWIARSNLGHVARIVVAPLGACAVALDGNHWYNQTTVNEAVANLTIDCVLVDGPPAYTADKARARYPALPVILDRLAPDCAVYLDDIRRAGEQDILKMWSALSGIEFHMFPAKGGIACGVRGHAFSAVM
jgi:predicted O-methyltransferase YrrM